MASYCMCEQLSDVDATQSILLHVWAAHSGVDATQSILLHVWAAHSGVDACMLLVPLFYDYSGRKQSAS